MPLLRRLRLRQGISDVVIRMNFAYLHISSVYDLSYEVEAPKNVFGSLMRFGFLCLRNGSIVITIELQSIRYACYELLIQTASFAASLAAMYSASVVESTTVSCFELFQLIAPPFRRKTNPDCDRESSLSVWKLASV
ncbi:hypothetical protein V6N13_124941 [Hibiscus sabdariffa]